MYNNYNIEHLTPDEVIVYLRKSRTDDPTLSVEEVLSKHETILDEWAEKNLGGIVPEKNKYREVVSGETIADRPEVQKVLKAIESPKIKAILIVEIQRLSRGDLEDAGRLIKLIRYTNTLVITPPKIYDLSDEYDRDIFERELKRGNEFLEYQKKIMARGRLLSVSQGNYLGSIPPYGYNKILVSEGKRKCPTLAINENEANVVRMIFDMYVNKDMGMTNICHALDDMKIQPPHGEYWSDAALKDMLSNVHYIGKVKWNWRKTVTSVENSEIVKTRPKAKMGDYLIYDGKHEAIIPDELFNAAQAKQGKNHRAKSTTKLRNPLAGLLYCQCGKAMTLRTYDDSEPRLVCNNQTHCNTGSCLYSEMITCVIDFLKKSISDFEIIINGEDDRKSAKIQQKLLKNLEKRLKELEEKEISQWEAQSNPDISQRMPPEIFKRLNEKLVKEKEEVKEAIKKANEAISETNIYVERLARFRAALKALLSPKAAAEEKNRLLKACIEKIHYNRERPVRAERGDKSTISHNGWNFSPISINVDIKV